MVEKSPKSERGYFRLAVLNGRGNWVVLPYAWYFGGYHVSLGDRDDEAFNMNRAQAEVQAGQVLNRLRATNPDLEYRIDEGN